MNSITSKKKVDWKTFIEKEEYREGTLSQDYYDETVNKLLESGIFSLKPEGNYQITACSVVVSPRHSRLWRPVLYFTRKPDAKKYAELKYANAWYSKEIQRIEETVEKKS